jgi:hypothetical protein
MAKSKILAGIGVLIAVVGLGVGIGLLASRRNAPVVPPIDTSSAGATTPATSGDTIPHSKPKPNQITAIPANTQLPLVTSTGPLPVVSNTNNSLLITNWEERLEEILGSDDEDTNKVKQLISMFPRLPAEGQEEVAQHLSNLVDDEDYAQLGNLTTNASLPENVLDTLLADLLNRPNGTKLPMFLDIAQNPNHAKAGEAKDYLELYLDEDYGNDWNKWNAAMKKWLEENPD